MKGDRFYAAFNNTPDPPVEPNGVVHMLPLDAGGDPYGQAALTREVETVAAAQEGTRNDTLNRAAYNLAQLVATGRLNELEVHDALTAAARKAGLTPREVEATLKSGHRAGSQQPRHVTELHINATTTEVEPTELTTPTQPTEDAERDRTSWWPTPLIERARQAAEEPAPTHLIRDDGQALFYSGKINGLIGESESGKSWIALLAIVQALNADQPVLMLDFEDSPASIHRRMQSLGLNDEQLHRFDYADPDEALGTLQTEDLTEALTDHGYRVILVDGVNAAMTLLGLDLNSNTDATRFTSKILRPLAATGACVITVDHVPKNSEQRAKGGIGAQAKRGMMDGCAISVEITSPFGKGQSGTLKLTVDKDRNGHVRGISAGSRNPGRAHLDSVGDQVRIHIDTPDLRPADERPDWHPTERMEAISRALEHLDGPASGRQIQDLVGGNKDVTNEARRALIETGNLTVTTGSNRTLLHTLKRPFRADDPSVSPVSPSVPPVSPRDTQRVSPENPTPNGGGFRGTPSGADEDTPSDPNPGTPNPNWNPWNGEKQPVAWQTILDDLHDQTWHSRWDVVGHAAEAAGLKPIHTTNLLWRGVQAGIFEQRGSKDHDQDHRQVRLVQPDHPLARDRRLLMAEDEASCNYCGNPTPDAELDRTGGYCRHCSHIVNGQ